MIALIEKLFTLIVKAQMMAYKRYGNYHGGIDYMTWYYPFLLTLPVVTIAWVVISISGQRVDFPLLLVFWLVVYIFIRIVCRRVTQQGVFDDFQRELDAMTEAEIKACANKYIYQGMWAGLTTIFVAVVAGVIAYVICSN